MDEPMLAWQYAQLYRMRWGVERKQAPRLPPRIEYAVRRVGGLSRLEERQWAFLQAYNEAPAVDGKESWWELNGEVVRMCFDFAEVGDATTLHAVPVELSRAVPESDERKRGVDAADLRDMRAGVEQSGARIEADGVLGNDCGETAADGGAVAGGTPGTRAHDYENCPVCAYNDGVTAGYEMGIAEQVRQKRDNWIVQMLHWIERRLG